MVIEKENNKELTLNRIVRRRKNMKTTVILLISFLVTVIMGCTQPEKYTTSPEARLEMEYEAKIMTAQSMVKITQDQLHEYQRELDKLLAEATQYPKESKKNKSLSTKASKVIGKIEYLKEALPKRQEELSVLLKEKPEYKHITSIRTIKE